MSEKNKNKKFNTAFLVLFFPVCALFLYTLYLVIRRPDVIHTFWLLLMSVLIILNFFWMQTGFFEDRNDLKRRIAEWDKRRREAMQMRVPFNEPKPVKSKKLTPVISVVFAIFIGVYFFSFLPLKIIDSAVPKGRLIYKYDIAKLKDKNGAKYGFLPDSVPKDAEDAKWVVFPSIMQGDGYEVLSFYIDNGYIEREVNEKCAGITAQSAWNLPVLNFLTDEQLDNAQWFPMHDEGENHRHTWGIVADPGSNFIAYFVQ